MVIRANSANPEVLRWARERTGLSVEAAAEAIGQSAEALRAWENGTKVPTYRQLSDLAHRVYKRPLAVFFFPEPPTEAPLSSQFRTLPQSELDALEPDTLYALRDARAWQLAIPVLLQDAASLSLRSPDELRAQANESASDLAKRIRREIGISVDQQRSWGGPSEALKAWRKAVEGFGVFVFKRSFSQNTVSGFCLDDDRFPVVVLNNSTAHSRQVFTLFHELGHLAFRVSGVTTREQHNLGSLAPGAKALEVACNRFAADFLVPQDSLMWTATDTANLDYAITDRAQQFNVSREVILRRLLDAQAISQATYSAKIEEWRDDYFRSASAKGGGSYYANQGTYLSDLFVRAAFHQYHVGRLSIGDLADHLRIKAQKIGRFEEFVLARGAAE